MADPGSQIETLRERIEETNRDYRIALRVFGRRTVNGNGDDPPESLGWVPSGTPRNYDPAPNPADMFHWDEDPC